MGSTARGLPKRRPKRWLKRLVWAVLSLALTLGIVHAWLFIHIVHPRLIRVVDAMSGKPIPGLKICLQSFARGWGETILTNSVSTSNGEGFVFFWPSFDNVPFLSKWYGYSIDITDPTTAVLSPCESLSDPDFGQRQFSERIGHSRADGTEHFPLLLDARLERPRFGAYGGAYGALPGAARTLAGIRESSSFQ